MEGPVTLVDSGATVSIAGRSWLEDVEKELAKIGLQAIKEDARMNFKGLGGARRESHRRWILPVGIAGKHTTQAYFEIEGDMIGLTSREDLEAWRANLYLRPGEVRADFENLGIYDKKLQRTKNGHGVLNILEFDKAWVNNDPIFYKFRLNGAEMNVNLATVEVMKADVAMKRDDWVQQAISSGRRGTISRSAGKQIAKLAKEYQTIFEILKDDGKTFAWELYAFEAKFTKTATFGGHRAGPPVDLRVGINLRDPAVQADILKMIDIFKPWIVTCAFPCTPYSSMQNLNRAVATATTSTRSSERVKPTWSLRRRCCGSRVPAGGWD